MTRGPRPPVRTRRSLGAALVALMSSGCVSKVTMSRAEGDDGERPHTAILYSGVPDASRQYADYTVVDEGILED